MKNFSNTFVLLFIITGFSLIWFIPIKIDNTQSSHHIQIADSTDARYLIVDGRIKGVVDTTNWKSFMRYVAVMDLPMYFYTAPGKVFIAGVGTGSLIKDYSKAGWVVDVSEPDSNITTTAQLYFNLKYTDANIYKEDGRHYFLTHDVKYDIILEDGLNCGDYPERMMTKEFFNLASSHLTNDGIFAISIESSGWHDELVYSLSATLKQSFHEVYILPIVEPPNVFGSIVLFASNGQHIDFIRDPERNITYDPNWRYGPEYQKVHAWDNHFVADDKNSEIFTDEHNTIKKHANRLRQIAYQQRPDYLP